MQKFKMQITVCVAVLIANLIFSCVSAENGNFVWFLHLFERTVYRIKREEDGKMMRGNCLYDSDCPGEYRICMAHGECGTFIPPD